MGNALVEELRAAVRAELDAIEQRAERAAERALRRVLAAQAEELRPLADILQISTAAAGKRVARDPGLRALGVRAARNRPALYRATAVLAYLESRGR